MTLEGNTLLQIQKWWYDILSAFCQYLSTNKIWPAFKYLKTENHNMFPLSSHQKYILNSLQQNKIMKNYQDHSEFTLLKMTLFPHQKHQNRMSKSFHTWMTTMDLTLLLLLYFHESSTRSTWIQRWRPCDILLPRWKINSPSITPQSSSGQKLHFPISRWNRKNKQPHR